MIYSLSPLDTAFPVGYEPDWRDPIDRTVAAIYGHVRLCDCRSYASVIRNLRARASLSPAEYAERRAEIIATIRRWRQALRALDLIERQEARRRHQRQLHRMAELGLLPVTLCAGAA
jgi:hypothetical protein